KAAAPKAAEWRWPYQKPVAQAPPAVQNSAWVRNPIDLFVLAKLEEKKLRPAPEAGKRTLARRVYFDLVGMPPTPAEMTAFLNDRSSDAFEKLIDRLLDDPRYGGRWGRHWLRLVRDWGARGGAGGG